MFYYLAQALAPHVDFVNVLTYHTVRAGAAAMTAFLAALIIGPTAIRLLKSLKIGQYIRKDHVADLHALHKGKAGTPTMGGALILFAMLFAVLLWAKLDNRLLWLVLGVVIFLGGLGFLDDYIKLKRKHNAGLSAKGKFIGQILAGALLGTYLYFNPIAISRTHFTADDILNWREADTVRAEVAPLLDETTRAMLGAASITDPGDSEQQRRFLGALNRAVARFDLRSLANTESLAANPDTAPLLGKPFTALLERDRQRLNRYVLEDTFPSAFHRSSNGVHTKVEVPGFRWLLIPLGALYILFVILIIVCSSNAVNLTDGLDGLAIGASIMSLLAYSAIAYVVSRSDWAAYLFLIHVPEASELAVFGAAMLGAGLGFMWFNCHPAEVFMGDTGSLALGGAIGAMAVLTKQELLLILVGGLFVMEAASVVIQVVSFKTRGKRVFRMAPLHHHFELLGWSETKVVVRFWIIALVFALMSLGALKLR